MPLLDTFLVAVSVFMLSVAATTLVFQLWRLASLNHPDYWVVPVRVGRHRRR